MIFWKTATPKLYKTNMNDLVLIGNKRLLPQHKIISYDTAC